MAKVTAWLNNAWPLLMEELAGAGIGGASNRMNSAKFTTSEDISETVPTIVPKFGCSGWDSEVFNATPEDASNLGYRLRTPRGRPIAAKGQNLPRDTLSEITAPDCGGKEGEYHEAVRKNETRKAIRNVSRLAFRAFKTGTAY